MRLLAALVAALACALLPAPSAAAWPDTGPGVAAGGARWLGPKPRPGPRRVVSLAPSATDLAIALGQAGRLVGVTRYDDAPEVAKLPRVGGFLDPSPEAVLALRPDLVLWVTDGGALASVQRIAALGVPVLALPVVSVEDVLAAARLIGDALGDRAGGERLAGSLSAAVSRTQARAAGLPRPRVLFVVGREPLVVAGPGSYPDELLRLAGARNVAGGQRPWPIYPLEKAVADDPDVVVDAARLEHGGGAGRLETIPAARRGHLVKLEDDDALRPGPRMVRALDKLFAVLHPEARR
ncbi:MAG TPA: helical backbone metal receptor [Anaeromyxobacteraceae bacterium]|jgi:iron complex transport system substrate-binding protein|nr:helical backbone metal receptor [Anaeromyxobacteraceae bacterium]